MTEAATSTNIEGEAMSDEEKTMAALKALTPEDVALLREMIKNVAAGRQVVVWLAWLGATATAIAGFVFYMLGIFRPNHIGG